ncbi:hypothetical protein KEM56_004451 [Ascosphaera pollenicola]|nr:hypothetical protein KEM56_004451 [Ascosphaera pollenicola]
MHLPSTRRPSRPSHSSSAKPDLTDPPKEDNARNDGDNNDNMAAARRRPSNSNDYDDHDSRSGSFSSKEDRRKSLQSLLRRQQAETDSESAIAADSDSESESDSEGDEGDSTSPEQEASGSSLNSLSSSIPPGAATSNRRRRPSSTSGPNRPPRPRAPIIPPNPPRHRRVRSESANDEYVRFRSEVLGADIPAAVAANSEVPILLAKELDKAFSGWTKNTPAGGIGHQSASAAAASRRNNFPGLNTGFAGVNRDIGLATAAGLDSTRYGGSRFRGSTAVGNSGDDGASDPATGIAPSAISRPRALLNLRSISADDVLTSPDTASHKFGGFGDSGNRDIRSGLARYLKRDPERQQREQSENSGSLDQHHNQDRDTFQSQLSSQPVSSHTASLNHTPGSTNTGLEDKSSRNTHTGPNSSTISISHSSTSLSIPSSGRSTPNIFADRTERGFANMNLRHQNGSVMANGICHGGPVGGNGSSAGMSGGMSVGGMSPRLAPINGGPVGGGSSGPPSVAVSASGMNSNNSGAMNMPMNAGHPMDLNYLYEMVAELGNVLRNNREMTKGIVNGAEEVMKRAAVEGASPSLPQASGDIAAARIADLERDLARERAINSTLLTEQYENLDLISTYEQSLTEVVAQIRYYCQNQNLNFLSQKRHYNKLLQEERDAHLQSRLERDHWHSMALRCGEMVREAYRIRCEEEEGSVRVVEGLQNEVRALRGALGMEREREEDETGWEVLKDYRSPSQGPN